MPVARFVMRFDRSIGRPLLPDGNVEGDGAAVFADGTPGYGWVTASHTPADTCIVFVRSTQAVLNAMRASGNYHAIDTLPNMADRQAFAQWVRDNAKDAPPGTVGKLARFVNSTDADEYAMGVADIYGMDVATMQRAAVGGRDDGKDTGPIGDVVGGRGARAG